MLCFEIKTYICKLRLTCQGRVKSLDFFRESPKSGCHVNIIRNLFVFHRELTKFVFYQYDMQVTLLGEFLGSILRISNKHGSLSDRKVSLLGNNMTCIQNTHYFRGCKLTFVDWFKFSLLEELPYEIDIWFQEKILTNDALDLIGSPALRLTFLVGSLF
jgi:hypothetical protein